MAPETKRRLRCGLASVILTSILSSIVESIQLCTAVWERAFYSGVVLFDRAGRLSAQATQQGGMARECRRRTEGMRVVWDDWMATWRNIPRLLSELGQDDDQDQTAEDNKEGDDGKDDRECLAWIEVTSLQASHW